MKRFYFLLFFVFNAVVLYSQDISPVSYELTVEGNIVENPYTGGLNSPQFNEMDVNLDGIKDLVVFDRVGDKLMIFIADDKNPSHFVFSTAYNHIFPDSLKSWIVLKDYNNDGREDIFTSYGDAIEVYKTQVSDDKITFSKYKNPYSDKDVLTTKGYGYEVFCYDIDIPAIVDVDFDGDLDVLSFAQGNRLYFYKNICVENDIPLDSFRMLFADQCWGKFGEDFYSEDIILSDNPYECAEGTEVEPRHSGSTTLTLDIDEDEDYDLIVGDVDYESAIFLNNGGDKNRAFITAYEKGFPQYSTPLKLQSFVGAFNIDIDNDGLKDLIFAPNEDKSQTALVQNIDNVHYYKNSGAGSKSQFKIVTKDFLVSSMLDVGGNTYPAFVDVDADGLLDIVLGTGPAVKYDSILPSRLYYFRNTGTQTEPKFELYDDDFLKMSIISLDSNLHYFSPAFGDIDGDGDLDLLVGNNQGTLIFYENIAGVEKSLMFEAPTLDYMDIDVFYNSSPCITDVNGDGLEDILIGLGYDYPGEIEYFGSIAYYQNVGSVENSQFDKDVSQYPNTNYFGKLLLSKGTFNKPRATLAVYRDEDDDILFAGKWDGQINVYRDFGEHIYDELNPKYKFYGSIDVGNESVPAVADIDSDGYLEMLIGTDRGGLEFWDTDIKVDTGVSTSEVYFSENIKVYPNPFTSCVNIQTDGCLLSGVKYKLTNISGITLKSGILNQVNTKLDINQFDTGIYFITFYNDDIIFTKRIIKN